VVHKFTNSITKRSLDWTVSHCCTAFTMSDSRFRYSYTNSDSSVVPDTMIDLFFNHNIYCRWWSHCFE